MTIGLAAWQDEARGPHGEWTELYHGTKIADPARIRREGLTADRYSHYNRVLTSRKDEAGYFAGARGAVVTVRIPKDRLDEFVDVAPQGLGSLASLKKPLPASMIHKIEDSGTGAEMSSLTEQYLDLGWEGWRTEPRGPDGKWVGKGDAAAAAVPKIQRVSHNVAVVPPLAVQYRQIREQTMRAARQQAVQAASAHGVTSQNLGRAVVESKLYTASEFNRLQDQINELTARLDRESKTENRSVLAVHLGFIAAGIGVALAMSGVGLPLGVALLLAAMPSIGSEFAEIGVTNRGGKIKDLLAHPIAGFRAAIGHPLPPPVIGMANGDGALGQAIEILASWLQQTGLPADQAPLFAGDLVSEWAGQNRDRLDKAVSMSMTITGQIDLAREAWRYEPRGVHGEWVSEGGQAGRYDKPDHTRLINPNARDYKDPGDHPWFKDHQVSAKNIVTAYDAATPEQKAQGMRWYEDAHNIAMMIGGGNAEKGAGLLAAYSPQTSWPVNMFNAARAAQEGRALGPGDGMITGAMQRSAQRMLNGESIEQVMGAAAPKISAFARLIKNGGDAPDDRLGQVVMDRHALSVAVGRRLSKQEVEKSPVGKQRFYEHIADTYRQAAHDISVRDGTLVTPHQLQAITWLQRQQANQAEDAARGLGGSALDKGRQKMTANAWEKWGAYARQHHVPVQSGTTVLSQLYADGITGQFAGLGQAMELAAWEHELRGPGGAWTRDGDTVHYTGSLGIDRADMPQLSGTLPDGSYASSAVMHPKFIAHLMAKGIPVTHERVPASLLHPTQATGSARSIHGIADSLLSGREPDTKPIFVSSDDRIGDGHHTWAARLVAAQKRPELGTLPITRVGIPIRQLLAEAEEFGQQQGLAHRATGVVANPAYQHHAGTITGQLVDLTGLHGEHIPGTPYVYHHGWQPIAGGPDTLTHFTQPGGGIHPERAQLHQQIVNGILAGHQPQEHPTATFLGGGTAAGKSTMLASSGAGAPDSATIDADHIKSMLPEYQQMLSSQDPRAAMFVHEESSAVAKQAVDEAIKRRLNYTLDGTGDSSFAKLSAKVGKARDAGYSTVAKYVTVDTDTAVQRAQERAQRTGRMVPETVIREIHSGVSGAYRQAAENGLFDRAELWDTNGEAPQMIARKEPGGPHVVLDEGAYQRFLAKEHQ